MLKKNYSDLFLKEMHENKAAFGHEVSKKIEIEPFAHPSVSLVNSRIQRAIKNKRKSH